MTMQSRLIKYVGLAITIGIFWAFNTLAAQCPIIDLGTGNGTTSAAFHINDKGQVGGFTADGPTVVAKTQGFLWEKGRMTDLPSGPSSLNNKGQTIVGSFLWDDGELTRVVPLQGYHLPIYTAAQVNNKGQVLLSYEDYPSDLYGVALWEEGTVTEIPKLSSELFNSFASAINNRGQIAGINTGLNEHHGFVWEQGKLTDLGVLGGGIVGKIIPILTINNKGQVAGTYTTSTNERHAFLWENGVMTDLGTLGGLVRNNTDNEDTEGLTSPKLMFSSEAVAINDKGQVIGYSITAKGEGHGFLWEKGVMTDLGKLDGASESSVRAINNKGQVIGYSLYAGDDYGVEHPFLWQKGVMTELKPLPGALSAYAFAINKKGQIVGSSQFSDNTAHATLWNSRCEKHREKE